MTRRIPVVSCSPPCWRSCTGCGERKEALSPDR